MLHPLSSTDSGTGTKTTPGIKMVPGFFPGKVSWFLNRFLWWKHRTRCRPKFQSSCWVKFSLNTAVRKYSIYVYGEVGNTSWELGSEEFLKKLGREKKGKLIQRLKLQDLECKAGEHFINHKSQFLHEQVFNVQVVQMTNNQSETFTAASSTHRLTTDSLLALKLALRGAISAWTRCVWDQGSQNA